MSRPPDDLETRLRRLPQLRVPDDLKRRVMAAASLAPRPSWRDRVWYSTAWRLAAAAMLVAVLVGDRWSAGTFRGEIAGPAPAALEESRQITAAGVEMGLSESAMQTLVSRAQFVRFTARESAEQAGAALR